MIFNNGNSTKLVDEIQNLKKLNILSSKCIFTTKGRNKKRRIIIEFHLLITITSKIISKNITEILFNRRAFYTNNKLKKK